MPTQTLTSESIEATIRDNGIVILDFWASWCGPCRSFAPIFEQASEKHADVVFGKINTEEEEGLAGTLEIRSIPTIMIFRDQILVYREPGALPGKALDDLLTQVKALDMDHVRSEIAKQPQT